MSCASQDFQPVQRRRHRRREQQRHQQAEDRLLRRDCRNHQSAKDAHADESQHSADATEDGQRKLDAPRPHETQQGAQCLAPADLGGILREGPHFGPRRCGSWQRPLHDVVRLVAGRGSELGRHQLPIRTGTRDQLRVRAALHDAAMVEHQDAIGPDHAGQPVRQDQRRAALHQPIERLLNDGLVLGIA
jgi:hypothetical protein